MKKLFALVAFIALASPVCAAEPGPAPKTPLPRRAIVKGE